jgi:hypothetical protein
MYGHNAYRTLALNNLITEGSECTKMITRILYVSEANRALFYNSISSSKNLCQIAIEQLQFLSSQLPPTPPDHDSLQLRWLSKARRATDVNHTTGQA